MKVSEVIYHGYFAYKNSAYNFNISEKQLCNYFLNFYTIGICQH